MYMDQLESSIRNKIFSSEAKIGTRRFLPGRSTFVLEFIRSDSVTVTLLVTAAAKIETHEFLPQLQNSLGCKITLVSADHKHTKIEITCPAANGPVSRLLNIRIELLTCWIQLNAMTSQKLQLSPFLEISCHRGQVAVLTRFATAWEAQLGAAALHAVTEAEPEIMAIEPGSLQHKQFFSGREVSGLPVIACFKISKKCEVSFFARIAAFSDALTAQVQLSRIAARGIFSRGPFSDPASATAINLVRAA